MRHDVPHPPPSRSRPGSAFSLVELLVVLAIIALLLSILMPALGKARSAARRAVCMSNQRQMTLALLAYTDASRGRFVPNAQSQSPPAVPAAGMLWWFGFEAGGPGSPAASNRPLDRTRSPLAPYFGGDIQQGLECPDFPRDDATFFPKFAVSSAHFGYNEGLAPLLFKNLPPHRVDEVLAPSDVFTFVDGIHTDGFNFNAGQEMFYEPHYAAHSRDLGRTGFAHFRHSGTVNLACVDGHVTTREQTEPTFATYAGSPAANLDDDWDSDSVYGFEN